MIWAVGQKQYDLIKEELKKIKVNINNVKNMTIVPYIYNMEEVMNLADVIVARSGAMTITEVAKLEKPAIFIPFPYATENHQEYNARVLSNVGAAKLILDKDLDSHILNKELLDIIENENLKNEMSKKAKQVSIQNVEEKIYSEIKKIVKGV